MKTILPFSTLVATTLLALHSYGAETALKIAVLKDDVIVYKEAKESAEPLGKFKKGTQLKVYFPDRNGWYATYFQKPVKGSVYGWMKAEQLEIQGEVSKASSSSLSGGSHAAKNERSGSGVGHADHWISVLGAFHSFSPSDIQNTLGITTGSVTGLDYSLEYGQNYGAQWVIWLRGGALSFTATVNSTGSIASGASYNASSLYLIAGGGYKILQSKSNLLTADLGIGAGMGTTGNGDASQGTISTSSIITFPILAKLTYRYSFGASFDLGAEVGYRLESLGSVPYLSFVSPSTQVNASAALTSPYAGLAVYYTF